MPVCVYVCVCVCAWSVCQSCPTLCNPMACSPPGSYIHGIFQAKYWSELPLSTLWHLLLYGNPGIRPKYPVSPALAGWFITTAPLGDSKSRECSLKCIGLVLQRPASALLYLGQNPAYRVLAMKPCVSHEPLYWQSLGISIYWST